MKFTALAALSGMVLANITQTGSSMADPGPFVGEKWYSGLVDLDHGDDMFYMWYESRKSPENDPIVLWLTGGPGCASEIAMFYENGPYQFNEDGKTLKSNP
jgi:carboxypeptidase C (cathepsin A)